MGILWNVFGLEMVKTMLNARTGFGGLVDKNPWLFLMPQAGSTDRPRVAGRMPFSAYAKSLEDGASNYLNSLSAYPASTNLQPSYVSSASRQRYHY